MYRTIEALESMRAAIDARMSRAVFIFTFYSAVHPAANMDPAVVLGRRWDAHLGRLTR
jgi:hypothetical protein